MIWQLKEHFLCVCERESNPMGKKMRPGKMSLFSPVSRFVGDSGYNSPLNAIYILLPKVFAHFDSYMSLTGIPFLLPDRDNLKAT